MSDVVSVERVIPATPQAIFALISDPHRHHEFDGSGTVREARDVPAKLALGSRFGMSMKMGVPYAMVSEVVEFEQDRLLAWQTLPPVRLVEKLAGGRIWRYELEPVEGGTKVTESWDIRQEAFATKAVVRKAADKTRKNMAATLVRIEESLAGTV
ncbi:MAG: Dimethyladenosine transferase methylation [Frankiales bacterium]|nr:Dimethyladenosine transferase methylation [Frankiales bacterium]